MTCVAVEDDNGIKHYGVIGMKWGIRRYQNYDGSYTRAGLARYNKSRQTFEDRKREYDSIKKTDASRQSKKLAKARVKAADKQVVKDYKHLKQDKMADKGKIRYMNGERIRGNYKIEQYLFSVGMMTVAASGVARDLGYIDKRVEQIMKVVGELSVGSAAVYEILVNEPNNQLRAYYAHTSKY